MSGLDSNLAFGLRMDARCGEMILWKEIMHVIYRYRHVKRSK